MTKTDFEEVTVSLVVPVFAGEKYLEELTDAVQALRNKWQEEKAPLVLAELIFVDDAAIDTSPDVIDRLAKEHFWIVPLHLSRNYGQHAATVAGILHSSGDWVVTLDEDLQHPPAQIPGLLARAAGVGADVVYAQAATDVHESVWRDSTSRVFKRLMQWLTGNPNLPHFNSFRLIRGSIARAVASVCAHDTYFDINLSWFTQRVEALEMDLKDERFIREGRSGYSFRSLLGHASRMLFSSQIRFLNFGVWLGFALLLSSFAGGVYFLVLKLLSPDAIAVQGWTSLFLAICLASGLLAFMLGVVLKYLSTLVLKAHGKPTFFTIDRSQDALLTDWFAQQKP